MTGDIETLIVVGGPLGEPLDERRLIGLEDRVWARVGERREHRRMGQVRLAAVAAALVIGGINGGLMLATSRPAPSEMQVFTVSAGASPLARLETRG